MVRGRSQACERIRGSISAGLDGELSELESARVREHLSSCDACRSFGENAGTIAAVMRAAPPEPLPRPVSVPSRRRRFPVRVPAAAAAAAVLMVAFGGVFASLHGGAAGQAGASFDNHADIRAIVNRQIAANYELQLVRRAQFQSNRPVFHPGPQNP